MDKMYQRAWKVRALSGTLEKTPEIYLDTRTPEPLSEGAKYHCHATVEVWVMCEWCSRCTWWKAGKLRDLVCQNDKSLQDKSKMNWLSTNDEETYKWMQEAHELIDKHEHVSIAMEFWPFEAVLFSDRPMMFGMQSSAFDQITCTQCWIRFLSWNFVCWHDQKDWWCASHSRERWKISGVGMILERSAIWPAHVTRPSLWSQQQTSRLHRQRYRSYITQSHLMQPTFLMFKHYHPPWHPNQWSNAC